MKNTFAAIKFWMDKILSIACAVLLTFMTVLVLIQVFSRYILNSPVAFTEELVRYSLIWTGFIGAAYAFSTREHMSLTLIRDKFTGKAHTALLVVIDGLILLMAIFVFTIGGFKLAVSASREFSALLGIPRSLVYSIAPISGVFIVLAQIINIYEDVTGEKVESKEGADKWYHHDHRYPVRRVRRAAVPRRAYLHQHCGVVYRDRHVHPVLGPDHLYHDAEDELRRGELLAACCAPVHSGRQHHE